MRIVRVASLVLCVSAVIVFLLLIMREVVPMPLGLVVAVPPVLRSQWRGADFDLIGGRNLEDQRADIRVAAWEVSYRPNERLSLL
jgi:hypothetical protein